MNLKFINIITCLITSLSDKRIEPQSVCKLVSDEKASIADLAGPAWTDACSLWRWCLPSTKQWYLSAVIPHYSVPKRNGSCFTLWGIAIMQSHRDREPIRARRHALGLFHSCQEMDKNKRQPGGHLGPASSTRHWDVSPTHRKETYSIKNSLERTGEEEKSDGAKRSRGSESGMSVEMVDMDVCCVWCWLAVNRLKNWTN